MVACRTIVYIGLLGSAYCLIGCDAIPASSNTDTLGESTVVTGKFFAAAIDEFATARAVTVEADSVTTMPTTVVLPDDLWENEPEEAALVLDASAVTVTMTGESNKRAKLTAKGTEKHAMMIFHIAPADQEACGSESVVGPFDMTIVDGVVTLTIESQPLDAAARSAVRNGRFAICAETWADFDGEISIENAAFEFGTMSDNEERAKVCHVPPGNPGNAHTITIAASAASAHLAHGDYLGECDPSDDDNNVADDDASDSGEQDDGQSADIDSDGVHDATDLCPDTPESETANEVGCSCSQLDLDADGVNDCDDICPDSMPGTAVTQTGCAEEKPSDDAGEGCYVDYDYTVIGNDGHSFYLDGEYVDGAGYGRNLNGTLRLSCGEHSLDVVLYNSVAGGAILFGSKTDDAWTVASEHPQITLRAEDGTADAWSVYRKLDCGYHSPFNYVPEIDSFETTFWMTVPERGAGLWNTDDAGWDHWIIWDDYGSTVVFPQSFWVSRTTLIVSEITSSDADGDGIVDDADGCPDTIADSIVDGVGCSCSQLGNCDADGDGVFNGVDECPGTPTGIEVDQLGCEITTADTDGDGTADDADACPDTEPNAAVNEAGCSCSQIVPCDDDDLCTTDTCEAGICTFTPFTCPVEYPYVLIGNDNHSFYIDGEYIDGGVFQDSPEGILTLDPGEYTIEVLLNNSVAGGAVLFGSRKDGVWQLLSEHPRISLRADDGTPDSWSIYRALNVAHHDYWSYIPKMGDHATTFWMTVPERGAGIWNTNNEDWDHWIIWDDYASTVIFEHSFWMCRTTIIVSP